MNILVLCKSRRAVRRGRGIRDLGSKLCKGVTRADSRNLDYGSYGICKEIVKGYATRILVGIVW